MRKRLKKIGGTLRFDLLIVLAEHVKISTSVTFRLLSEPKLVSSILQLH